MKEIAEMITETETTLSEMDYPIYVKPKRDVCEYWAFLGDNMLIVWSNGEKTEIVTRRSFSMKSEYLDNQCSKEAFMNAYLIALRTILI